MAQSSTPRQAFETDGESLAATAVRDQHAPALSSNGALARFEFEAGRGNEGTKILMVEWDVSGEAGDKAARGGGGWEVSWDGKTTAMPQREGVEGRTRRLYFLLPPGSVVPPIVKIQQVAGGNVMQTNPLPALFPAALGVSAHVAGKKGVLHTIWAKQRLSVLQQEIDRELLINAESIGLEMALKEQEWIRDNFGIGGFYERPEAHDGTPSSAPRSPGGGRLGEKLKGLKLGTSPSDLSGRCPGSPLARPPVNPLSPDVGDVAVSSFSIFHGGLSRPNARAVAHSPPNHVLAQQAEAGGKGSIGSLDAIAGGHLSKSEDEDNEDGLFAVRMSPRSPEMPKSPFSFSTKDVVGKVDGQ
ncbi:MAG: hypothetical protein M1818_004759 [Claussenomyces sp. TS43310]|nr:MAG: hypothetical protein M1818_004759 [Claussenomyces sp. TS43310]